MRRILLMGTVASVLALGAGCMGDGKQTEYHVYASTGLFAHGFAYDGTGTKPFGGDAALDVSDKTNSGILVAKGKVEEKDFVVTFDRFSEAAGKPFQDGGIAADFHEHGTSGVGDRSVPQVDLAMAGWGKAKITRGTQPYIDPITGSPDWTAHFMVIRNGVRNDTTGGIYQDPNNSQVYDPATGVGHSAAGDWELHLVLRNGTTDRPSTGATILQSDTEASATYDKTGPLFTANAAGSTANFNVSVTGLVDLTFTFYDPAMKAVGAPLRLNTIGSSPPVQKLTEQVHLDADSLGDYKVKVTGRVTPQSGWEVRGVLMPPPLVVYNLWWENLLFGDEAAKKMAETGLVEHGH